MAKKSQRVFALTLAILFLVSSVGFTGVIIWQAIQEGDDQTVSDNQPTDGQLQGTKLANFEPLGEVKELQRIDLKDGTGETVKEGATITAHYTGALASNGTIFQSSLDMGQPATFGLDQVIPGWTEGVPGMKVGGTRRLIIPAELAYGAQSPSADIPPNSALVFDIELIQIEK